MKTMKEIANKAIEEMREIVGTGYEAVLREVITNALKYQDRNTRHACAEAVLGCEKDVSGECVWVREAHSACMNVKAQ